MTKISKYVAAETARKFVASKFDALDSKHILLTAEPVRFALEGFYGASSLRAFRALPRMFHSTVKSIDFRCAVTGRTGTVQLPEPVIVPSVNHRIGVDRATADILCGWLEEKQRLKDDRRDLVKKSESTLLSLGTFARVRAEWPEIAPFLPKPKEALPLAVLPSSINVALERAETPPPART